MNARVLVIGSGIAGVSAALEAARTGARVTLASLGDLFSGSSFAGGTWGLGLVGPDGSDDIDDLVRTILDVGCGVADPVLVETLVTGVGPAVSWLESMGVELRRPTDATQREYVPCFDHKRRSWHGLVRENLRRGWSRELARLGVDVLPHTELLDLVEEDGHVTGAILAHHDTTQVVRVCCDAVVLASGGLAGIYARSLAGADACGSVQGIALSHGCSLINSEFLQIMPGIVHPVPGVVLNEKAFRYSTLPADPALLDERSCYGPFTTRLPSCAVDLAISRAGSSGAPLSYRLPTRVPELVQGYFDWLEATHGIRPQDEVRVTLFAHASNGGLRILPDASCPGGPVGLFACGECAGGMHGADRIGGLASASALVFGRIAGRSAARAGGQAPDEREILQEGWRMPDASVRATTRLREAMDTHALLGRTDAGLRQALDELVGLGRGLGTDAGGLRARNQILAASAMLRAMLARTQSLGSHHRSDR